MCVDGRLLLRRQARVLLGATLLTLLLGAFSADAAFAVCTASLSGSVATFTCNDPGSESVTFSAVGGQLRHNIVGSGFNSTADFDSSVGGDQALAASTTSQVTVNLTNTGPDHVIIGTPASPAGALLASFLVSASNNQGDSIVVDDSGSTVGKSILNNDLGITAPLIGGERLMLSLGNKGIGGGITLLTGTAADTVSMPSVANFGVFGPEPRIVTATNGDTITVGNGLLTGFQRQTVTINAASQTNASVIIQDQNTTSPATYTYTAASVLRGATPTELVTINTTNVSAPSLAAGSGGNTIVVRSALASGTPSINAGGGDDTVTVVPASGGLEAFVGGLSIIGGGGNGDSVVLDDTGSASANTYALSGGTVSRNSFVGVTVDAGVAVVRLLAGGGANTFNLAPLTFRVDIVGNANSDALVLADGLAVSGNTFDGAGGVNTLNYAAFTSPVAVNLASGTATGLGSVTNVSTAIGGQAGDTLVGGAGVDTLNGGPGDDTLTGGPGNDILNGDGDSDTFVWNDGDGTDTFAGGAGTDTVRINGSDGSADIVTVTASGANVVVTRLAPSAFTVQAGPSQSVEQVAVFTLAGSDQVIIQSVPTGVAVLVDTGDQDDTVTLDSNGAAAGGTVKTIMAPVQVIGGTGTNTLAAVDSDSPANSVATITPTQAGAAGGDSLFGAGGSLSYSGISTLLITFSDHHDTVTATPSGSTAYVIAGGPPSSGDSLDILQAGASSPNLTGDPSSGQYTASNRQPVTFGGFEALKLDGASSSGVIQFAAATFAVDESGGTASIALQRTGGTLGAVSVFVSTTGGTATPGADYTAVAASVTFAAGQSTATVAVPVVSDAAVESAETVLLALSNPEGGATLGAQSTAVLTITNAAPTATCTPRPRVQTQTTVGGNQLGVHVEATPLGTGQNNRLTSLRFGQFDNARVTVNGQLVTTGQTVTLPSNTVAADFSVERVTAGQATTVRFTVVDACGEWSTFVGGGTGAGF